MKNSPCNSRLSIFFFLMTFALALFSWVANIYGWGDIQSLLSAEGIRWFLGHVVENYVSCPALGIVLILLMGLGVAVHAGLYGILKRLCQKEKLLSHKERWALTLTMVVCGIYVMIVVASLLLPWNFMWGITGAWLHSPFSKGLVYVLSIGIGLSGVVYGYVSGNFRRLSDVMTGMSYLIARESSYFVALFFITQFFSLLVYMRLPAWMHLSDEVVNMLYLLCSYLPLITNRRRA